MDRKKCKRIIKNVSRLLLARLAEILEENWERKEDMGEKMVGKKYTWLLIIAFKRTACRRSG
jgi:hypothetical protein